MCGCSCTCALAYVGPQLTLSVLLDYSAFNLLTQGLSVEHRAHQLASLASQLSLVMPCLCLQSTGVTMTVLAFKWVLGILLLLSTFVQPFICALSHYPIPSGEVPIVIYLVANKRIKYMFWNLLLSYNSYHIKSTILNENEVLVLFIYFCSCSIDIFIILHQTPAWDSRNSMPIRYSFSVSLSHLQSV